MLKHTLCFKLRLTGFLCLMAHSSTNAQFDSWSIILHSGETLEGSSLVLVLKDSLTILEDDTQHSISLDSVSGLKGFIASRIYKGAFIGALGGGLLGGWIFAEYFRPQFNRYTPSAENKQVLTGGVIGLTLGGILGGLIGYLHSDKTYDLSGMTARQKARLISKCIRFEDRIRKDSVRFDPAPK
jgi:hypothetical protein